MPKLRTVAHPDNHHAFHSNFPMNWRCSASNCPVLQKLPTFLRKKWTPLRSGPLRARHEHENTATCNTGRHAIACHEAHNTNTARLGRTRNMRNMETRATRQAQHGNTRGPHQPGPPPVGPVGHPSIGFPPPASGSPCQWVTRVPPASGSPPGGGSPLPVGPPLCHWAPLPVGPFCQQVPPASGSPLPAGPPSMGVTILKHCQ